MSLINQMVERFSELAVAGGLSIFGGIAAYVHRVTKTKEPFNLKLFAASAFLAFFIGCIFGNLVPEGSKYRDGIFMLCGFLSYPILSLLETDGLSWFKQLMPVGLVNLFDKPKKNGDES